MVGSITDSIFSSAVDVFNAGKSAVAGGLQALGPAPDKHAFSYDVFPSDLGSSYYGHFMTITAVTGTGAGAPGQASYAVGMFIPSAESGSGIIYEQKHEYVDIKLANLAGSALGAMTRGIVDQGAVAGLASYLGRPINPGVEVLYKNTDLREFAFTFLMAPQNEQESRSMNNIIKKLRYYAAPDLSNVGGGVLFTSPAEFIIKFYNKGVENTNIPKIKRCVLTDITIDFTPSGEWSTFRNGHPVACRLALAFKEMEIIHRTFIDQGY